MRGLIVLEQMDCGLMLPVREPGASVVDHRLHSRGFAQRCQRRLDGRFQASGVGIVRAQRECTIDVAKGEQQFLELAPGRCDAP